MPLRDDCADEILSEVRVGVSPPGAQNGLRVCGVSAVAGGLRRGVVSGYITSVTAVATRLSL